MKCNMSKLDRLIRFVFGVFLLAWAFAGGPVWAYAFTVLIFTAAWGFCPLYTLLKIRTLKDK